MSVSASERILVAARGGASALPQDNLASSFTKAGGLLLNGNTPHQRRQGVSPQHASGPEKLVLKRQSDAHPDQ